MNAIELFAGGGGLALGVAAAGFKHEALVEWDAASVSAMRTNVSKVSWPFGNWNVIQGDVSKYTFRQLEGKVDLVSGGPPCQPFSVGGKHLAFNDRRDMFPEAARVIREVKPRAFIFENVRGLTREAFKNYFQYVKLRLEFPEETIFESESWLEHLHRLEGLYSSNADVGLRYMVNTRVLNAAEYGVPQHRHRVFIVGFRSDVHESWGFPSPTHCEDELLRSKWLTYEYWDEHRIAKCNRPEISQAEKRRLSRLPFVTDALRWRTVRDAVSDLPSPTSRSSSQYQGHKFQPGAKPYPGHTGSRLDNPAKTLKAGDHGVPGGENMLATEDGQYRYFTVRESARLQTFPDTYEFPASWTESMRQIGNAVPVELAKVVADSVRNVLERYSTPPVPRQNEADRPITRH